VAQIVCQGSVVNKLANIPESASCSSEGRALAVIGASRRANNVNILSNMLLAVMLVSER
jgi:hypothetical protein